MKSLLLFLAVAASLSTSLSVAQVSSAPWLQLPTENRALFEGSPQQFYMHVDRTFEGEKSTPWEGGQYGMTRTPQRQGQEVIHTRFHEGVDIRPVRRDASGEPLDPILAAAAGTVVHASTDAGGSNYGRYLVIEHTLNGSPYYTLYAHLASISVRPGDKVSKGQVVARMGYTGRGINKERAHLHFEFCMMLNRNFPGWFAHYIPNTPDLHGAFNGMNLQGMDPIGLLKAVRARPATTVPEFLETQKPLFTITINNSPNFDLIRLYPWLVPRGQPATAPAWEITFSDSFVPLRVLPRSAPVSAPEVKWLGEGKVALSHQSRGLVTGSPSAPRLTDSGTRFAHLLTFPDF